MKSKEGYKLRSNLECGMLIRGEPVAVKAARRVRRGEWRKVLARATRSAPTLLNAQEGVSDESNRPFHRACVSGQQTGRADLYAGGLRHAVGAACHFRRPGT